MCGRFGFYELKYFLDLLRQLELPFEENQDYPKLIVTISLRKRIL